MVAGLTTTGILCEQTLPYYLGVTGIAAHLLHQVRKVLGIALSVFSSNTLIAMF